MQLTLFLLYFDKKDTMHSKTNNIKFMSYNLYEAIDKLFESLLSVYQIGLSMSMKVEILFLIHFNCCITNAWR